MLSRGIDSAVRTDPAPTHKPLSASIVIPRPPRNVERMSGAESLRWVTLYRPRVQDGGKHNRAEVYWAHELINRTLSFAKSTKKGCWPFVTLKLPKPVGFKAAHDGPFFASREGG